MPTIHFFEAEELLHPFSRGANNYPTMGTSTSHGYCSCCGADRWICRTPRYVSEINATDWSVFREIRVGKEPEHLALTADGATLYAVNVGDGTVSVVELASGKTARTFRTGKEPHGIALSSDGRLLFVSSLGDGTLSRIDLAGGEIKTVDLKPAPYHVAYADDLNKLYVSSRMVPKIWVIDPHELKVREEIDIGRGVAHQMVIRHERHEISDCMTGRMNRHSGKDDISDTDREIAFMMHDMNGWSFGFRR